MLMALLPFTAWAANFNTDGSAVVDDIPYGGVLANENIHFTLNGVDQAAGIFEWEGKYYTNANATTELTGNPQVGQTYYIKVVPATAANNGYCIATVTFVKADLTLTVKSEEFFVKSFLEAKTALPANLIIKEEDDPQVALADVVVAGLQYDDEIADVLTISNADYEYDSEHANATAAGAWFNEEATNKITFTGFTLNSTNYNLKFTDTYMKIKQIALVAADYVTEAALGKFTVTRTTPYNSANKPVYTGLAQNPEYEVNYKYGENEADVYTFLATDFVVKYKSTVNYDDAIDALDYTPVISFKENGNFSGVDIDLSEDEDYDDDELGYGIGKKTLYVLLNTNTKEYDGAVFLANENAQPTPAFNYSSLVGQDAGKNVTGLTWQDLTANTGVTLKKDVNSYSITFTANAFDDVKIVRQPASAYTAETAAAYNAELDGAKAAGEQLTAAELEAYNESEAKTVDLAAETALTAVQAIAYNATLEGAKKANDPIAAVEVELTKNYTPIGVAANWTITKKAITITAAPEYEEDRESITFGEDIPNITITEEGALAGESAAVKACYKATTAAKTALLVGNNVITVALKPASDYEGDNANAKATAKANAEKVLANYSISITNGVLVVDGVGLTIIPNIAASMEYGATPTPTSSAFNSTTHSPVTLTKTPVYLYRTSTETTYDENATTAPTAVGSYFVTIKEDGTLAPVNGYDPEKITYEETPFEITPKALTLVVNDQIVIKEDNKAVFLNMLANSATSWELDENSNTVNNESLTLEFSLNEYNATTNPTGTVVVTDGKIMSKAEGVELDANGYIANAILVKLIGETAGNYDISGYTVGKLQISEVYVADLAKDDALETIAAAAANTNKYNVTISGRKLNGGVWNAMVLPFDVEAFDFCKAIGGYAIFNTLKSAENGNVKFGLYTGTLTANEPFLVKPNDEVDFDDWTFVDSNENDEFDDDIEAEVNSVTKTKVFKSVVFKNATPTVTVDGVRFIGNYDENPTLTGGEGIMALQKQEDGSYKFVDVPSTVVNSPFVFMGAYLNTNTAGARIFVEEADGSVTAISTITADGQLIPAEGWYTLNGVKLQSAPTAKGVYINNGKKVVVK